MGRHERFLFRRLEDVESKARELGLDLPVSRDIGLLLQPAEAAGRALANRLAIHPMEGADAEADGGPGELTFRRYERFGTGGCGLIWFEAAAVVPEGRSNPRQILCLRRNTDGLRRLVDRTRAAAERVGPSHLPLLILQLTHSGRFAKPAGPRSPSIVRHIPALDALVGLEGGEPVLDDEALDRLQDDFVKAAGVAAAAGFDGVDIKACHGYLVSELLGAFGREGRYGGPFENRTRFLRETVGRIRDRLPGLIVAVRLNAADALPFPFGFGAEPGDPAGMNFDEAKALVRILVGSGLGLLNVTMGIPFQRPQIGRPFNRPVRGGEIPEEHPLEGVARLIGAAAEIQAAIPGLPVVGTGYSWLRQFAPFVAAGVLERGKAGLIGFGRMAFAYPDFALDLSRRGRFDPRRVCLACSGCSELARAGRPAGCAVRDRDVYRPTL
ncbi:MAG: flavin oxidoreductase/NADH oxidase [Candidatus Aminicenantes bacterium]|nr:flavin oxidoreductase/NADH oxidase [Candidatus Aminicenantes bacterium]